MNSIFLRIRHSLLVLILLSSYFAVSQPVRPNLEKGKKSPLWKLEEFHRRDGLPNVFWKIKNSRQVRIAYLGGSITSASEGWRELTFSWFRLKYPHTAFYQINAAIGGTGSLLGAFRIEEVIKEKPDLIFVEFAVNDENDMSLNRRIQSMEGIVRKTWAALPNTDICIVYTTAVKFCVPLIEEGKQYSAVLDHEKIADHYKIPSIDMGIEVARLCVKGQLLLAADPAENANSTVFFKSTDHYHPLSESGHPVYANAVVRYLQKMSRNAEKKEHQLPNSFKADNWQKSQLLYPEQTELTGDWERVPESLKNQFGTVDKLWKAGPGATMKFSFDGNELGLYDCVGPGTGIIQVTIDGKVQEVNRFDHNCSYWRRHAIFLEKLESGIHQVEIKVTGQEFDKKSVMKPNDDPAQYARFNWYPIGILIVGKLIK